MDLWYSLKSRIICVFNIFIILVLLIYAHKQFFYLLVSSSIHSFGFFNSCKDLLMSYIYYWAFYVFKLLYRVVQLISLLVHKPYAGFCMLNVCPATFLKYFISSKNFLVPTFSRKEEELLEHAQASLVSILSAWVTLTCIQ